MGRLLIVIIFLVIILFIFWQKNRIIGNTKKANIYNYLIWIIIILGVLFFLATAGKFILPKLMQIIKMALPALTKLIPALTKIIGI
tara:strand:- start:334 stop:591 length:258 start_codon:yes stop_codon:yes gene_type:complete